MSTPPSILAFTELLRRECEGSTVSVDSPRDPNGEYWLDISVQRFRSAVSWKPKIGFGIFMSDAEDYGARPDEIYSRPEDACARICQLVEGAMNTRAKT